MKNCIEDYNLRDELQILSDNSKYDNSQILAQIEFFESSMILSMKEIVNNIKDCEKILKI